MIVSKDEHTDGLTGERVKDRSVPFDRTHATIAIIPKQGKHSHVRRRRLPPSVNYPGPKQTRSIKKAFVDLIHFISN